MSNDHRKQNTDKPLETLFIEELGGVVGGAYQGTGTSTGQRNPNDGVLSTQALGEDGAPPLGGGGGGMLSTQAVGEDGAPPLGGGGGGVLSTQALGEDGAPPLLPLMPQSGK
jgi:hypothetical protein